MNLFFRKILLACSCIFVFDYTVAQVNFYSVISPQTISKDEYITYRIIVENASGVQSITPPSLKNFIVLNGPVQESGFSSGNGSSTRFVSLVYILKPKKAGKFKIGPATSNIGGKLLQCNAISLSVTNSAAANAGIPNSYPGYGGYEPTNQASDFNEYIYHKGDNLEEKVRSNMYLKLETDKSSCYVGEPVIATYKLYSRLKSESKLTQNPSFNGFSVIDMQQPDVTGYAREKLNGREYNVYIIRKAQLYPLQSGVINLEAAELENNVQFVKEIYAKQMADAGGLLTDFAAALFPPEAISNQLVSLKSEPVNITVKPLPEDGKPPGFNGAVGNFEITASLQKPLFSTEEAGKLVVTISGTGNMQLLTAPDINWPAGIESFEPKFSENLVKATVPVSGSKKFEYTFALNDTGHFNLPAIRFSYFDVSTEKYRTIESAPITFQVIKGSGRPFAMVAETINPSFLNTIFSHRWWIIAFIGLVMLTILLIWMISSRRKDKKILLAPVYVKDEQVIENEFFEAVANNQQNVFSASEKCLYQDNCFGFYSLLNTELKTYLARKFSVDVNSINCNSINVVMDTKGIANETVLKLQKLMQEIEWQLYTPFERNDAMHEKYRQAQELVQLINADDIRHQ